MVLKQEGFTRKYGEVVRLPLRVVGREVLIIN